MSREKQEFKSGQLSSSSVIITRRNTCSSRRLNIESILLLQVANGENRVSLSFEQVTYPASQPAETLHGAVAAPVITEIKQLTPLRDEINDTVLCQGSKCSRPFTLATLHV